MNYPESPNNTGGVVRKYRVIYADPPWRFGSRGARGGRFGDLPYQSMAKEQLKRLNVVAVADDDCALFMWTTGAHIAEAIELGQAWGFRFVRYDKAWIKVWPSGKPKIVPSPHGPVDMEHLLLFVKGSPLKHQADNKQTTAEVCEYAGKHSRKPHRFRELIERRYPDCKRLEMFAREKFPGWDVWGNEVETEVVINDVR